MPKRHGRTGEFWLADSGDVLRNLTTVVSQVDFPRTVDTVQVTCLSDDDHTYVVGPRGGNIRLQGYHSETSNELDDVVGGIFGGVGADLSASAFKYFPAGSVTGRIVYSGSAFVTNYNVTGGISTSITGQVDLVVNGSVTRATV